MIAIQKRYFAKPWMTSDETSMMKQRFFAEHFPRLKPIVENGIINKRLLQKQPILRSSSIFPPITHNAALGMGMANSILESPKSSVTYNSTIREPAQHSMSRHNLPSFSPRSSLVQIANNFLARRISRYDHVHSKINTGLPRTENMTGMESDTCQLEPSRPLNWSLLKQELEHDTQIRAQTKRIQFNSGIAYTTQLTALSNLVRSKVKSHISSPMNCGEERYKIVVQLSVFQTKTAGLHIASRCLWNPLTDNSVTIKMQGVDCDILIVVFLCYTDLGAI